MHDNIDTGGWTPVSSEAPVDLSHVTRLRHPSDGHGNWGNMVSEVTRASKPFYCLIRCLFVGPCDQIQEIKSEAVKHVDSSAANFFTQVLAQMEH